MDCHNCPMPECQSKDLRICQVVAWMRSAPPEPLNCTAKRFAMSTSQLFHLFKKQTGRTPKKFWAQLRISAAAQALRESNLQVKAIADLHGFKYHTHFVRAVQRAFGTSPSGVRAARIYPTEAGGGSRTVRNSRGLGKHQ